MSKKEELIKNEIGAYPCKACLRKHITSYPILKNVNGLIYAQCSNCACDKFDLYEFIGNNKNSAIRNWNEIMAHDYDSNTKKNEDE